MVQDPLPKLAALDLNISTLFGGKTEAQKSSFILFRIAGTWHLKRRQKYLSTDIGILNIHAGLKPPKSSL